MSILVGRRLAKAFGADDIFEDVNVEIPQRARIALVGPNGAGKTTLLNILVGLDAPTQGDVTTKSGLRIGFLPQRPELHGDHTLWEEQLTAFADLRAQEAELARLEAELADADDPDAALERYGELQHQFEDAGGYTYEQRIRTVLGGLGFKPDDYNAPIARLSGGQKTRALLARLLLEAPALLALDEPTNHLDIQAIEWLEGYLNEFPGAVLVVSHDRYFMDAVATTIWELDFGSLETYRGNYSAYIDQRAERHARLIKDYEAQQEFIAKEQEYIRRNLAGQNTKQAQGRRTRLQRLLRDGAVAKPRTRAQMTLRLNTGARSGDKVLMTDRLQVGYADAPAPLFTAPDLTLWRGEVAALIGANGAGKSTFVKTIIGQIPPLGGEATLGASVRVGYFAQAHESLDPTHTLLDEIDSVKPMTLSEARGYLARFQFTQDDPFRKVDTLSGGERGRLALAKLALAGANLLLLDEPTNHLDIPSQEILQDVLANFDGTILLVSHDRYLVAALATQIWSLTSNGLEVFKGSYAEFIAAREAAKQAASDASRNTEPPVKPTNGASSKGGLSPHKRKQRLEELEADIQRLEMHLNDLTDAIASASASGNGARVSALGLDYTQTEAALHAALAEWEALAD